MKKTKLNMGSGRKPKFTKDNEWEDVDIRTEMKPTIVADIRKIPRDNATYDEILLQSVLEHFGKRQFAGVIREAHRLLKVGGKLIVSVPDMVKVSHTIIEDPKDVNRTINLIYGEQDYAENQHKWGWTFESLKHDLEIFGFGEIKRLDKVLYDDELRVSVIKSMKFYGQFGEDKFIFENLEIPEKGYFIDIGAGDGLKGSNTKFFENRGWQGLCIEPDSRNYFKCIKHRKNVLKIAVDKDEGEKIFFENAISPDLSGLVKNNKVAKEVKVKTVRLDTLIKEHNIENIDLLSVDTEGTELRVLDSFKLKKVMPKIVIIEYITQEQESKNVEEYMKRFEEYQMVQKYGANLIYIHDSIKRKEFKKE